jgi:hypothetical protein
MQEVITKNISEQKIPTNEDVSELPWAPAQEEAEPEA